jgi:hypothetical protein
MSKSLKTPAASRTPTPDERRTQRLEAALRMNLKKRKDKGSDAPGTTPTSEKG